MSEYRQFSSVIVIFRRHPSAIVRICPFCLSTSDRVRYSPKCARVTADIGLAWYAKCAHRPWKGECAQAIGDTRAERHIGCAHFGGKVD